LEFVEKKTFSNVDGNAAVLRGKEGELKK